MIEVVEVTNNERRMLLEIELYSGGDHRRRDEHAIL